MSLAGKMFDKVTRGFIAVIYGVLVVVGFAQVVARYVFNNSLSWSEELALILLTWMVFIAAGVAVQQKLHIGVDLLTSRLGERWQRILGIFSDLLVGVFVIFLIYYGAQITANAMVQTTPAMGLPMGYVYAAVPVGGAVMLVNLVRNALTDTKSDNAASGGT
jgi:C4-dicarboxylate transporter DctQ subunit